MADQAQRLREMVGSGTTQKTQVIAVTSGKGGVGKSNVSLNLALSFGEQGKKVLIIDTDLGFANIDVLMGKHTSKSFLNVIQHGESMIDVIQQGIGNVKFIAGGSGLTDLLDLQEYQIRKILYELSTLEGHADIIIIDTGAGVTGSSLAFLLAANDIMVVCTPEPTAVTDAYALIKLLVNRNPKSQIHLLVNRVLHGNEGKETFSKMSNACERFLGFQLRYAGSLPDDAHVSRCVREQTPFLLGYPHSAASKGIRLIANQWLTQGAKSAQTVVEESESGMKPFLQRFIRALRR